MAIPDEPKQALAAPQVFALPELLENILIHADAIQLFVLQSINSTFQGVIKDSKEIRRKMFLEPSEDREALRIFLEEERIKSATYPLTITPYLNPARASNDFDFELPCEKVTAAAKARSPIHELWPQILGRQDESWRRIRIGAINEPAEASISCQGERLDERVRILPYVERRWTLGDALKGMGSFVNTHEEEIADCVCSREASDFDGEDADFLARLAAA